MYQCICGETFSTKGEIRSHKYCCKVYQEDKKKKFEDSLTEKVCENCGKHYFLKELEGSSNRFCSKFCARSFASKKNSSENRKRAMNEFLQTEAGSEYKRNHSITSSNIWKDPKYHLEHSLKIKASRTAEFRENMSKKQKEVWSLRSESEKKEIISRTLCSRTAGKKYEDVWEKFLINMKIPYQREYPIYKHTYDEKFDTHKAGYNINKYRLDFLVDNKIDLEIDGKSHNEDYDNLRDNWIKDKTNLVVYRVKATLKEEELEEEFNKFLEFYRRTK